MAELTSLTLRYTAPPSATVKESRWIRLEQLQPQNESLTVAEAAQAIDALFGIEPCETGLEGGGDEVAYDEEGLPADVPSESRFAQVMRGVMGDELCEQAKHWYADVLVLRSHQQPGYTLRSETAKVVSTSLVQTTVREELDFDGGTSKDLGMPYGGDLAGVPAGITAKVLGSTVNLSAPAGRLSLRYTSRYEQVRLQVPVTDQASANEQGRLERPELPEAAVVAFWGELAAACELSPPEQDERISQDELERICRGADTDYVLGGSKECWQTLEHYSLCNCSRRKTNTWNELVAATCPEGTPPGTHYLGSRGKFDGYVYCEGEEDEVSDPEYYKEKCCTPPPGPLPRCRKTYAVYHGGAAIEGGAASWRGIYGANVRLVPVSPKNGICGELITEWQVESKNCCDEVEEQRPHPDNPSTITAPGAVQLCVLGGQSPRKWQASAGYHFDNGEAVKRGGGGCEWVYASAEACDHATINVDDGCSKLSMQLQRSNPPEDMEVAPQSATVSPGSVLILQVIRGGHGRFTWSAGGLNILSGQGTRSVLLGIPDNACGVYSVSVSDQCGEIAQTEVLATVGYWREVFDFDPCSAPWGEGAPATHMGGTSNWYVANHRGWRAIVRHVLGANVSYAKSQSCPHEGSCGQAFADGTATHTETYPCGYTGRELIVRPDGSSLVTCNQDNPNSTCYPLCRNYYQCFQAPAYTGGYFYEVNNLWAAATQYIVRLWRWSCQE